MKQWLKKIIRKRCPNLPFLREKLTAIKLKEITKYTMESVDIELAEGADDKIPGIVQKYSEKWPQYTEYLCKCIDEYLDKCPTISQNGELELLKERALFNCYAYGFMPDEFFGYSLNDKSLEEKLTYISDRDKDVISYSLNDIIDIEVFFDKYRTYQKFRPYYKREAICVQNAADYDVFVAFVKEHPTFVKKNVWLSRGDSVELIDTEQIGKSKKEIFDEILSEGKHIIEELVVQSDTMKELNASSVNTIRCMTFRTEKGVQVGPCFLKVGRGNSFVDNGGAGGILVGINSVTGVLDTDGFDEFLVCYEKHPDTLVTFEGYQLPDWDDVIAMAKELGTVMPNVRYIGWDMAHTNNGWVIIEGNGSGQFVGPQFVWQRGFKEDIKKILDGSVVI